MRKVDSMAQNMLKIPYAVVLLVENPNLNLTTNRHAMSPAVVSKLIKHASILELAKLIFTAIRYKWTSNLIPHRI